MRDFEYAKDKLLMGKERRSMVLSDEEKKMTAYHEAGHAIVGSLLPETDPLHKVTIIPRGRALGVTMFLPEEDKHSKSRTALESQICMSMGGRAAELLIFGNYTTGAAQDIKQATQVARSMVCRLGMSERIGPVAVGDQSQEVFIGREWISNRDHSEETSRVVDAEIKRLVEAGMQRAEEILRAHLDALHNVAGALLERETINGAELKLLMDGQSLPPPAAQEERRPRREPAGDEDEGFLIEVDDALPGAKKTKRRKKPAAIIEDDEPPPGDKGPLQ
jgi:cell division protease FtsH